MPVMYWHHLDMHSPSNADQEGMANFEFAEQNQFILAEERTFLRKVVA